MLPRRTPRPSDLRADLSNPMPRPPSRRARALFTMLALAATILALVASAHRTDPPQHLATPRTASTSDAAVLITLPTLNPEATASELVAASDAAGGALRLGFGREITTAALPRPRGLTWRRLPDGRRTFALRVRSPGAAGLRLALRTRGVPDSAELRFSTHDAAEAQTLPSALINASLAADAAAGSAEPLFWSPLMPGDTLTLRITLPAGIPPREIALEPARLTHLVRLPGAPAIGAHAGATDPACQPSWDRQSRATTLLLYTSADGGTGACTGTLVADADPATAIPYVLTAHHCFPDQQRASSVESFWLLRAETCGGPVSPGDSVPGGADLLYRAKSTDTALLRLRQPPPTRTAFVQHRAILPTRGTETVGLHHPLAGPQQLTRATVSGYKTCVEVDWCDDDADPEAIGYLRVEPRTGATEAGSSGSGLFDAAGRVVGVLLGGSDTGGFDYYGRIGRPYSDGLARWLGPGAPRGLRAAR